MTMRSKERPAAGAAAASAARQPLVGRLARACAFTVVSGRYLILLGWAAAAALAMLYLPSLSAAGGVGIWCRATPPRFGW